MTIFAATAAIVLLAVDTRSFTITTRTTMTTTTTPYSRSSSSPSSARTPPRPARVDAAASSSDEDIELTRRAIMSHAPRGTDVDVPSLPSHMSDPSDYPDDDLMIRAALGRTSVERTPVWLFRQAGRHLPEYNEYKRKVGRSFLEMLSYPEDVAECTLQPVRRYDVDAAILFSDILVIAEALNVEVTMPGGVGIQVPCPLVGPADMRERLPRASSVDRDFVRDRLGHVMESVRLIRTKMREEGISKPLIGFSAAPWTLLFYMVGGSSKKNRNIGMEWLANHPDASKELLDLLTTIVIEYMSEQVECGVHMLQLFEAMGMMIDETEFNTHAMPCLERIASEMKSRYPDVPLMVFARGASHANEKLSTMGYDIVTIDGDVDRSRARDVVDGRAGLQGNYDPGELVMGNGKTVETVRLTAGEMLAALGPQRLIANLGEGLGGNESPELVAAFVDAIHEESERMIRG
ncbi:hypothetical protein ACHAXA_001460 [Cyclostephanos tholiformis]|uniref:Uroporphyrinogen decarboxylase n=1 Tax=Cyclostephanos tholiformis TaxID=382380 RepID=A0ABD3RZ65_9STRA